MENRDWMSKDRRSVEYDEGVEDIINFALAHPTIIASKVLLI